LEGCANKRDILIESRIRIKENPQYKDITAATAKNDREYYQETRKRAREELEGGRRPTHEERDAAKYSRSATQKQEADAKAQQKKGKEEDDRKYIQLLRDLHVPIPDSAKTLTKAHMIAFFRKEKEAGRKVKLDNALDVEQYREKFELYVLTMYKERLI
jgi:hypothetical protein